MGHYVYKYVQDGEIVYIGKNDTNLETRINQHKLEDKFKPYLNSDIYYTELANEIMSDVVESELIRRYKPKLNVAKTSDWSGLEFVEPKWKLFKPTKKKIPNIKVNNIPSKRNSRIKICKLMSQYYCSYMLKNISKVIEDDQCYKIEIPISKDDVSQMYCVPPYIKVNHAGISLGYCYGDEENVVYVFKKEAVFSDFYDVGLGLVSRIQYMKNMFNNELKELSVCG